MEMLHDIEALRESLRRHRLAGRRIALVPTMGNLHEGHLHLVDEARMRADIVVATLFVNPLQFAPGEDFERYPKTLEADRNQLAARRCDLLFVPSVETLYPNGLDAHSRVHVPVVSEGLCGGHRPGHFDGVSTVVSLLFHLVQPDVACFGEKDYQQLAVIRKLVADLHFPIDIVGVPTARADNGLALSSRNGYLSVAERDRAAEFYRALCRAASALTDGQPSADTLDSARRTLTEAGFDVDYLELRACDLTAFDSRHPGRLLGAIHVGRTRLIDNVAVDAPEVRHA